MSTELIIVISFLFLAIVLRFIYLPSTFWKNFGKWAQDFGDRVTIFLILLMFWIVSKFDKNNDNDWL